MLWASIPCTGGSSWQHVNLARHGKSTRKKVLQHRKTFREIWKCFEVVADECISSGGKIAIEWHRSCLYWHFKPVKKFIEKHSLLKTRFDGCMYGLTSIQRSTYGWPLKKGWTVMTNCVNIVNDLNLRCDGSHHHALVQGQDTKRTEGYSKDIVLTVHKAWQDCVM